MARFRINRPIQTREAAIRVDAGLPVGRHRFQLVVADEAGNQSKPDIIEVVVRDRRRIR